MSIICLEDLDGLDRARVLVRVPAAASAKGDDPVADLYRTAIAATVDWLVDRGAVVALAADVPAVAGESTAPTLAAAAATLAASLGRPVEFVSGSDPDGTASAIARATPGAVLLLENLARLSGEWVPGVLSEPITHVVDDAFADSWERHPLVSEIAGRMAPSACAVGRHMQNEVDALACLMNRPDEPFVAVVGGRCLADKMAAVEGLVLKAQKMILGGGVAAAVLNAAGRRIGCPTMTDDCQAAGRTLLEELDSRGVELVLPVDLEIELADGSIRTAPADEVPPDGMMLDIGPRSRAAAADAISGAPTLFWNGTMGRPDDGRAGAGSNTIAGAIAGIDGYSVVAGASTLRALFATPHAAAVSHVSLGGKAALMFISGADLPGLAEIEQLVPTS